jgi:O-antigen/teichoic acid export membrane protein
MNENPYRKLGGQTLIYGLGTIVPRLLNYVILTIYYTRKLEVQEYGIITELYAYIAIFLVILTYGMETGYFKFYIHKNHNTLFSSTVITLFISSAFFILFGLALSGKISRWIQYENYPEYVRWAIVIVSIDAFTNIFIAKIRIEEKLKKFVINQLLNVIMTVVLVIFFLEIIPKLSAKMSKSLIINYIGGFSKIYLIFLANFISSGIRLIILLFELKNIKIEFDKNLVKEILLYSLPLLIAQLSGIFNETVDRILLRHFLPANIDKLYEIGIYGANYRIAMIMTIFIQMFRYAADPFYFKSYHQKNSKKLYADVFKYFAIFCLIIFLLIMLYIDYFKFFIDRKFHSGLYIVPIILISSFLTGVLFNLNVWYRLTGKTYYGIVIIGSGAVITIILNALLIPRLGYYGCALTHLVSTVVMIFISYMQGKRFYPVPYEIKTIFIYMMIAFAVFAAAKYSASENLIINTIKNSLLFFGFLIFVTKRESLIKIFIKQKDDY